MSKEVTARSAMKLALEALNAATRYGAGGFEDAKDALREELAKPDFWEGYVPEPDNTCSNALRAQGKAYPRTCKKCGLGPCVGSAQQALDKMAENARELGLDYEPAQQEPVATITITQRGPIRIIDNNFDDCVRGWPDGEYNLYTSPQPAQRTWVGLTDEEIQTEWVLTPQNDRAEGIWFGRRIEAKLKEKNT